MRIFQVYSDTAGSWRWRIKTRKGRVVGGSQESFDSKRNAVRAANREASFYQVDKVKVEVPK